MTRFFYMALVMGAIMGSFSQANACSYCGYSMYSGYPTYNSYSSYPAYNSYSGYQMYNSSPMYSGYSMYSGYPMFSGDQMYSEFPYYSSFMMGGVPYPMFDAISNPIPLYMIDQYDVSLRHPESSVIGY